MFEVVGQKAQKKKQRFRNMVEEFKKKEDEEETESREKFQ